VGFLDFLSGGFVALVIASLLLVTIGFLSDSVGNTAEPGEPKPFSRPALAALALLYLLLGGLWIDHLLGLTDQDEPDWFMVVISTLWIGFTAFECIKFARAAITGGQKVQIPE
jgi:hypothetical protein